MPTAWEQMNAREKLTTLRSELTSLRRVTESVAHRIKEIENQLNAIESAVGVQNKHSGARGPLITLPTPAAGASPVTYSEARPSTGLPFAPPAPIHDLARTPPKHPNRRHHPGHRRHQSGPHPRKQGSDLGGLRFSLFGGKIAR
jgi:hypothetical protein